MYFGGCVFSETGGRTHLSSEQYCCTRWSGGRRARMSMALAALAALAPGRGELHRLCALCVCMQPGPLSLMRCR